MDLVKKYLPVVPAAFFALAFLSVFMNWESASFLGVKVSTSLWDSESAVRFLILLVTLAGMGLSVAALLVKNMKVLGLANAGVALLGIIIAVLYMLSESSDADDLGVDFGWGFGFFLAIFCFLAAMALAAADFVLPMLEKKPIASQAPTPAV